MDRRSFFATLAVAALGRPELTVESFAGFATFAPELAADAVVDVQADLQGGFLVPKELENQILALKEAKGPAFLVRQKEDFDRGET